jgi:hypothetical protein
MLLLSGQNGTLRRHRHGREFGQGRVTTHRLGRAILLGLTKVLNWRLRSHGQGRAILVDPAKVLDLDWRLCAYGLGRAFLLRLAKVLAWRLRSHWQGRTVLLVPTKALDGGLCVHGFQIVHGVGLFCGTVEYEERRGGFGGHTRDDYDVRRTQAKEAATRDRVW